MLDKYNLPLDVIYSLIQFQHYINHKNLTIFQAVLKLIKQRSEL